MSRPSAPRVALCATLVGAVVRAAPVPATEAPRPQTRPAQSQPARRSTASPSGSELAAGHVAREPLRGTGILILDPRDPEEDVKARLRQFVLEVRANIPPGLRQEEIARQVDALLQSDLGVARELPQLSFVFPPEITSELMRGYLENTPAARESRRVCPAACPVAAMFKDGFHVHLTRPAGGAGDSVLAIEFAGAFSPPSDASAEAARLAEAQRRRQNLLERYPEMGYKSRPAGRLFGVRVYLGEPLTPEEAKPPEP